MSILKTLGLDGVLGGGTKRRRGRKKYGVVVRLGGRYSRGRRRGRRKLISTHYTKKAAVKRAKSTRGGYVVKLRKKRRY